MKTITDAATKLSSGLLVFSGSHLLLLKRSKSSGNQGTWGVPGGQRLKAEPSYLGAMREAEEELSSVPRHAIVGEIAIHRGARRYELFACKTRKRIRRKWVPTLNAEHVAYRWVDLKWCLKHQDKLHPVLGLLIEDPAGLAWLRAAFQRVRPRRLLGARRTTDFTNETRSGGGRAPQRLDIDGTKD